MSNPQTYTNQLVDLFKAKHNLDSDYAAAKLLEIRPNRISNYRTGVSHADDKTAVMLAKALGLDPFETIARVHVDRATDRNDKAFWRKFATASLLIMLAVPFANSAANYGFSRMMNENISYALCEVMYGGGISPQRLTGLLWREESERRLAKARRRRQARKTLPG